MWVENEDKKKKNGIIRWQIKEIHTITDARREKENLELGKNQSVKDGEGMRER
jgi:hypothetical protein